MQIGLTAEQVQQKLDEKAAISNNNQWNDILPWNKILPGQQQEIDEDKLPFHEHPRFKKLIEERNILRERDEKRDSEILELKKQLSEVKKPSSGIDPNMPFDEAIAKMKEDAINEAIARIEQKKTDESSQYSQYERLVDDWFDYLRDTWIKINSKDEDAIADIVLKYNLPITKPEDMKAAFEIYDMARKTAWSWKAREDGGQILWNQRSNWGNKDPINYSQTSWSNLASKVSERLWLGN